jgi:hypothetical protein
VAERLSGTLHVVGGGIAGIAAALIAARSGRPVVLYEATSRLGGRCRTIGGVDNGTHVLLGANRGALALLAEIGARANWIEPEPDGLPVVAIVGGEARRIALSPWRWVDAGRRPPGVGPAALLDLAKLALFPKNRPVAASVQPGALYASLVEPLTLAALNTPPAEASSKRLAAVLCRLARPGAARLYVARRGLELDLIAPAARTLRGLGTSMRHGARLTGLDIGAGHVRRLIFRDHEVGLGPADAVVLALPPSALPSLLPHAALPTRYEPIVNLHFEVAYAGRVRLIGLLGGLGQWLLARPGRVSVTISAAREAVDMSADVLAHLLWQEVIAVASHVPLAMTPGDLPRWRIVKERRATISQRPGPTPRPERRPLRNMALAGDWLSDLPATIEAAVATGRQAARDLVTDGRVQTPLRPWRPVRA